MLVQRFVGDEGDSTHFLLRQQKVMSAFVAQVLGFDEMKQVEEGIQRVIDFVRG